MASQSKAIEGYIARLTGLYPAEPIDALVCDVVRDHYADAIEVVWKGECISWHCAMRWE